ncbi:MAG: Mth938-like domain-containing protein [Gammaproteobacteria bacterium]|nr:Mth938-like domain-containing protein [Gammaproteobacteria bacterium]
MQFILDMGDAHYRIHAYEAGRVRINEQVHERSLVVSRHSLLPDWRPRRVEDLTLEDLEPLLATEMEVLLLGTGETHRFPSMDLLKAVQARGRSLDVMDNHAACRTYAVLSAEGRKVALGLLIDKT